MRGDATDGGGNTLTGGQQAIIRNRPGQPREIIIQAIPDDGMAFIEDKVTLACNARRTVYFDVADKKETGTESGNNVEEAATATAKKTPTVTRARRRCGRE
ncbi:MAG: hypothetical protein J6386_15395 [Candidatus Synoicihabitans palmerolidicus]|nr:hypothetical protein [Candidatus Synoicihabitans palmerolidicus]